MTYTIRNHPGGYDIYKDGECLSAEEVVGRLEDRDRMQKSLREILNMYPWSTKIEAKARLLLAEMEAKK